MPKGNHKGIDDLIREKEDLIAAKTKVESILVDVSDLEPYVQLRVVLELIEKLTKRKKELKNAPA